MPFAMGIVDIDGIGNIYRSAHIHSHFNRGEIGWNQNVNGLTFTP